MKAANLPVVESETRQIHDNEPRDMEFTTNAEQESKRFSENARARRKNAKADDNIEPFLRMLWDHNLIDCNTNPNDATLETRIKIEKFVYFAQECFGLQCRYRHIRYLYGPFSARLSADYFRIRNIWDVPSGGPKGWSRQAEFLDFAKNHNDVKWLEIASTLAYSRFDDHVDGADNLVKRVQKIKRNFPKEFVVKVHDELVQMGFLEE